jgi:hypothetical protein
MPVADATEDDRPPHDTTLTDRRRPGRVDYQDPQLVALLRGEPTDTKPATAEVEVDAAAKARSVDDLSPAHGILIGLFVGSVWGAAIIMAVWYFL